MPLCFLEAPAGISQSAKTQMMAKASAAVEEAYSPLPDVRIYLREYSAANVAQNGRLNSESPRIVFFVEGPPMGSLAKKKKFVEGVHAALAEGYQGLTKTDSIAILVNEYPIQNAAFGGRLQSENPDDAEALMNLKK